MRWMVMAAGLGIANLAQADMEYASLRTNPFLQPVELPEMPDDGKDAGDKVIADMELRATVVAGDYSQANIGGVIVGLGDVVNGYSLAEVHTRHVVLDRDGTRMELRINDSNRGSRN
jgi:hypothetical protein